MAIKFIQSKAVAEFVATRDKFNLSNKIDPNLIVIPGRMQTSVLQDGSTLIIDGAHNGQKIRALVSSFIQMYPGEKCEILLALKTGKEFVDVINGLMPIAKSLILTTFDTSQDMPAKSQNPNSLEDYAQTIGVKTKVVINHHEAYELLLASKEKYKLVVGSFYLISQL